MKGQKYEIFKVPREAAPLPLNSLPVPAPRFYRTNRTTFEQLSGLTGPKELTFEKWSG